MSLFALYLQVIFRKKGLRVIAKRTAAPFLATTCPILPLGILPSKKHV